MNELLKDPMVLREIIMDHYQYPHNKKLRDGEKYKKIHMASESCIDDIYVQADIEDGVINDIAFTGEACTISTASTSIMTDLLKGKTIEEANKIIDNYIAMTNGEPYDEELLGEAICMSGVSKQANRIKCATIGWHGIEKLIAESEEENG